MLEINMVDMFKEIKKVIHKQMNQQVLLEDFLEVIPLLLVSGIGK